LESILKKRNREINELTRTQAELPTTAVYLQNMVGTAPGMWFNYGEKVCVALPGVPYEMKQIVEDEVIPRLSVKFIPTTIEHRYVRTIGVPETTLAQKLDDFETLLPESLKLAYLPGGGQVKLRLTARGNQITEEALNQFHQKMASIVSEWVYATEDIEIEKIVAQVWEKTNQSLTIFNDLTFGRIYGLLANLVPDIGKRLFLDSRSGLSESDKPGLFIRFSSRTDEAGRNIQLIEAGIHENKNIFTSQKELAQFPQPETNTNMLSLWALDLLRRILIKHFPENIEGKDQLK
jgi:hypothetical protein